jgi:hypothetical protein
MFGLDLTVVVIMSEDETPPTALRMIDVFGQEGVNYLLYLNRRLPRFFGLGQ